MSDHICPTCGAVVERHGKSGPMPTYCSRRCRSRADYLRGKATGRYERVMAARRKPPIVRACIHCGSDFEAVRSNATFCSKRCGTLSAESRGNCSEDGCARGVRALGLCNAHYQRVLRVQGRMAKQAWTDRRKSNYHARRARLAGGRNGDPVILADIIARDGVACAWCGLAVDLELAWPDRFSKSVDHIVPLARGGAHVLSNCQLMHLGCNSSKGARVA